MDFSIEPRTGIRLALNKYFAIKAWQGGGELLDGDFQLIVGQLALASFLPRATKENGSVLYKMMGDGQEIVSESVPVTSMDQVPARQIEILKSALAELKAKAEDPLCDANKRRMIEAFRLPNPQNDPELYRLAGPRRNRRLIVLWGVEKETGSALIPLQALSRVPQKTGTGGGKSWLLWLLAILAILALLAAIAWFARDSRRPSEPPPAYDQNVPARAPSGDTPAPVTVPDSATPSGQDPSGDMAAVAPVIPPFTSPRSSPSVSPASTANGTSDSPPTPGLGSPAAASPLPTNNALSQTPKHSAAPPVPTVANTASPRPPGTPLGTPSTSATPHPVSTPSGISSPTPASGTPSPDPSATPSRQTPGPTAKPSASPSANKPGASPPNTTRSIPPPAKSSPSSPETANGPSPTLAANSAAMLPTPGTSPASSLSQPAASPMLTSLKISRTLVSDAPKQGRIEMLLNVLGRDNQNGLVTAPPVTEWRVDGVTQIKDGKPVTDTSLPVNLPKGTHRVSVIGKNAEGKVLEDEAMIDVDVTVKEEGTTVFRPAKP